MTMPKVIPMFGLIPKMQLPGLMSLRIRGKKTHKIQMFMMQTQKRLRNELRLYQVK